MRVHFIAIGGSAMHNLAIALHKKGYQVTGSDDEIFEPSRSRLAKYGLLPEKIGWNPEIINDNLDAIILGMHARPDNPELQKATDLGLKVYSYPEYLYEQTKNKTRVVIGGSHGKTSITSMIMHVLKYHNIQFDYMVGAQIEGFDTMVSLTEEARIAVFEGDEYLSSPIDRRPKFHLYQPHIALLSGIAWDHINVFPTFEGYVDQFRIFAGLIQHSGSLIYYANDPLLKEIGEKVAGRVMVSAYKEHPSEVIDDITHLKSQNNRIPIQVFGAHNLQNLNGARKVCNELGVSNEQFYEAIASFKGASRRLEVLASNDSTTVFYDFAHSPSKLKATTQAVKEQFSNRKLVACMELHTFSSLKKEFLPEYNGAMDTADTAFVFFNPETIAHKKLEDISIEEVKAGFNKEDLNIYTNSDKLFTLLSNMDWNNTNLLLMSSGNYAGKNLKEFAEKLIASPEELKECDWYMATTNS
ncbi:peptidoglycan synthetase [Prolixibacteraceae bacterium JC049]|nr:peptidoglycan synthetase [Prolixibacteraceae bacterium JC049]